MGSSEVDDTPASLKIINYLNELCSHAIALGMSMKEYWQDDPALITFYIEAENIRQRKRNYELWLQGAYIYNAIGCLVPVLNPFSKDHKAKPYLDSPIPLTEEERQQAIERKIAKFMDSLVGLKPKEEGGQ